MALVEFGVLSQVNDAFGRLRLLRIHGIRKMRTGYRANRNFLIPAENSFPRCAPAILLRLGVYMHHSHCRQFSPFFCVNQCDSLFPIIRSMIVRKCPRRRSVGPKLWWYPGITGWETMLFGEQKPWNICKINPMSLPTTKMSGFPNAANQCEIAAPLTISEVRSPLCFAR